jgi:hypothetical protein
MNVTEDTESENTGEQTSKQRAGSSGKAAGRRGQFTRGNAPKGKPFPKGVSGNPLGTSKTDAELKKIFLSHCPEAVETVLHTMRHARSPKARLTAAGMIFDYGLGKPRQAVEISTDPIAPPQFNISFALGGPGNPLKESEAAAPPPGAEPDGVEVSGDLGEPDEPSPLSLPEPHSFSAQAPFPMDPAPPRLPPDPQHPHAVTIDADGTVWEQLTEPPAEPPAKVFASRQEQLERRKREHAERVEQENIRAREAGRIRAAKLRGESHE